MRTDREECGFALLEAIMLSLVLLFPIVWMLTVASEMHRGALAATAAVREAGNEAARSADRTSADLAVRRAVEEALTDHGLDASSARVRFSSDFRRGGAVEVQVSYPVTVLRAPLLGDVGGPVIWIRASHAARIDPFRSVP